jgi:hypothetical protein
MQYLLIICHEDAFVPSASLVTEIVAWIRDMHARGLRVYGNPLRPPEDAITVRVRNGVMTRTKGPFAETAEKMAAYELIECASHDQAVDAAARHPMARAATIEVRPVWAELVR